MEHYTNSAAAPQLAVTNNFNWIKEELSCLLNFFVSKKAWADYGIIVSINANDNGWLNGSAVIHYHAPDTTYIQGITFAHFRFSPEGWIVS